jgi:hypothetical protein
MTSRPSESLLAAAQQLRAAEDAAASYSALRDAARAIEFHLDTLSSQLRPGGAGLEPRLRPAALRIQSMLQAVLTACWAVERSVVVDGTPQGHDVDALVADLKEAGSDELDLVFDSLNTMSSME